MRVFFFVLILVIAFGFLGFLATNPDTAVDVKVIRTVYTEVPLWKVVLITIVVTAVLIISYGLAEGSTVRLENRRLRRELHKLETEINYLRTQPSLSTQPGAGDQSAAVGPPAAESTSPSEPVSSAPVYGEGSDEWVSEADDDAYSGGRAV